MYRRDTPGKIHRFRTVHRARLLAGVQAAASCGSSPRSCTLSKYAVDVPERLVDDSIHYARRLCEARVCSARLLLLTQRDQLLAIAIDGKTPGPCSPLASNFATV